MSDAINQHKKLAMGKQPSGSGGKPTAVSSYAKGGKVKAAPRKGGKRGC